MTLQIYLDAAASGRVMAHLLEPPGLGVRFPSRDAMVRDLPGHLKAHLAWLQAHGEAVLAAPDYVVAEEIAVVGDFESGDDVGFYAPDTVPPTPAEVERYLRIAGHAHTDLLALVEPLDDAALDWVRDERTRSIRRVLRHIAGAEHWYMTRIIDDPKAAGLPEIIRDAYARCDATEDMVERVRIVWPAFQRWASNLTPQQRARNVVPTWFTSLAGERWTARKMLRRWIEHCREHTRSVEQILADYRQRVAGGDHEGAAAPQTERL